MATHLVDAVLVMPVDDAERDISVIVTYDDEAPNKTCATVRGAAWGEVFTPAPGWVIFLSAPRADQVDLLDEVKEALRELKWSVL